jgi:hypothetical protein
MAKGACVSLVGFLCVLMLMIMMMGISTRRCLGSFLGRCLFFSALAIIWRHVKTPDGFALRKWSYTYT